MTEKDKVPPGDAGRKSPKEDDEKNSSPGSSATDVSSLAMQQVHEALILKKKSEAKKILRKILRQDPDFLPASNLLKEIQNREIDKWIHAKPSKKTIVPILKITAAEASQIEADLRSELGMIQEEQKDKSQNVMMSFKSAVLSIPSLSHRDRLHWASACLMMELPDVTVQLLEPLLQQTRLNKGEHKIFLSACELIARAYLSQGRAYQCISPIEWVLAEAETSNSEKISFFYLMGLAFELLGHHEESQDWFRQAHGIDPYFRDVRERVRKVKPKK